jgi:predicted ester cyclase
MARTGDGSAAGSAHAVPMTEAQNAATFRRWFDEGCSQGNVDLADELYSAEYVTHALGPQFAPTLEGLKMFIRALREGLPDLVCPMEEVVAEGERVAGRFSLRGTHTGTLLGIPATGQQVNVGVMVIARFDERGKWIEDWASWDQLGMLQQLGVIPAPAAA